jgi:hypothetical protein
MAQTQVYGVRETLAEIKKIDEALYWECVTEIKAATKPLVGALGMEFGFGAPLSGMNHNGRTGWKSPKIQSKFGGRRPRDADQWGLVKIVISGAAAQISDLAAKSSNGQTTRQYGWKNGQRTHKVNGQGTAMVANLPGKPSRYVWPIVDSFMPMTTRAILAAIESASKIVNKNLVLRND